MKWIVLNLISTLYFIICLCYWLMNSEIFSRYQIVKLLKLQVPLALLYIIEVEAKCAQHAHTSMHPYVPFDDCEYSLLHFSKLPTYFHNLHMSICDIFFLCAATIWKVAFWRRNRWFFHVHTISALLNRGSGIQSMHGRCTWAAEAISIICL